jgi:hypothetical protein
MLNFQCQQLLTIPVNLWTKMDMLHLARHKKHAEISADSFETFEAHVSFSYTVRVNSY